MVDSRGGNWEEFFSHESSSSPPALASEGSINSCNKSDLLACIMEASACTGLPADAELVAPDDYGGIVIDSGALIHSLPGTTVQGKNICWIVYQSFLPKNPAWVEKSSESGYCMGSVSLNVNQSYHKRKARKRHTTASIWFCQSAWKLEEKKKKKKTLSNAVNFFFHSCQQAMCKHYYKMASRFI